MLIHSLCRFRECSPIPSHLKWIHNTLLHQIIGENLWLLDHFLINSLTVAFSCHSYNEAHHGAWVIMRVCFQRSAYISLDIRSIRLTTGTTCIRMWFEPIVYVMKSDLCHLDLERKNPPIKHVFIMNKEKCFDWVLNRLYQSSSDRNTILRTLFYIRNRKLVARECRIAENRRTKKF